MTLLSSHAANLRTANAALHLHDPGERSKFARMLDVLGITSSDAPPPNWPRPVLCLIDMPSYRAMPEAEKHMLAARIPMHRWILLCDHPAEDAALDLLEQGLHALLHRPVEEREARYLFARLRDFTCPGEDSALKDCQAQSQATSNFLRILIDAIPAPIFYKDKAGIYLGCNEAMARFLGRPPEEIIGRTVYDVAPPNLAERYHQADMALIENPGVQVYEAQVSTPEGLRDVIFHKATYYDPDGAVGGMIGVITDITEKKNLTEQLRHAQKMRSIGQLTGGIAHDFNNILAIMIGNLELLNEAMAENERLNLLVRRALAAGNRAASLTQKLLAFSRKQPLKPQETRINRLLSEFLDFLQHSIGNSIPIDLIAEAEEDLATVDRDQLENAILNLAINARDAMGDTGRITIRTSVTAIGKKRIVNDLTVLPGRYLRIDVIDTGQGMSEETARHAIDPFFTTKKPGEGTGLGLSMVYGFITQSGGFMQIDSTPGKGTDIILHLPLVGNEAGTKDR